MDAITVSFSDAIQNIVDVSSKVMGLVTSNELLLTLFCGSLFFLGCGAVKAIKKVAKK